MVESNYVYNNTGGILAFITPGLPIKTCDDVVVEGNIISDNDSAGIAFTDFSLASNTAIDPDSEPGPNRPKILNNVMRNNGGNPAGPNGKTAA